MIFDPALAADSPLFINGNRPLQKVECYFTANRQALQCFRSVFVSTRALSGHVGLANPEASVSILPNSLPRLFQSPDMQADSDDGFTIGYFPGSNSHSHDMEMIAEALADALSAEPDCNIVVMGRMKPDELPFSSRRVRFKPFVDYNQYLRQLAGVDLSIAPLQRNIFNDSKSAVKLIESVAVGTPILASENPDMVDHQNPMSLLVKDASDWLTVLIECVQRRSVFDCSVRDSLKSAFSVAARLPALQQHLSAAT